jgi:hypothetical protein
MKHHIKRFNENQEINYWSNSWDEIYDEYSSECLNGDGDYSMTFIEWLKKSYPDDAPRSK